MKNMINEILVYLFKGFEENGGASVFPISPITSKYSLDAHEVGRYLKAQGLVNNSQFHSKEFLCDISNEGIRIIKPEFIDNNLNKVISILGTTGGGLESMMTMLDFEPKDFQIAHRLAHIFKNMGLIDAQFIHNDIHVELTFKGKMYYEEKKAMFGE